MKKSPVYPKHETIDCNGYEFDPQVDFSQFLEEARHHARGVDFRSSSERREETGKKRLAEEKKSKKSWKKSLFTWWKAEKKNKPQVEPASSSHNSFPKRGQVSGPIYGSGKTNDIRHRHPTSGPLTSLFNPSKRMENEIPYTCLDQLDIPHPVQTYGPVYLVT